MQKISVFVVFFGAVLTVASTLAAEPGVVSSPAGIPQYLTEPSAEGEFSNMGPCYGRPCWKHGAAGYCNCNCRGSYKYPVPPRDMYFWPGIYSQKTMTSYVSPYRYPGLLPPDVLSDASNPLSELPRTHSTQVAATPAPTKVETQAKPVPRAKTALRKSSDQQSR